MIRCPHSEDDTCPNGKSAYLCHQCDVQQAKGCRAMFNTVLTLIVALLIALIILW
jgi:hypothetical protein